LHTWQPPHDPTVYGTLEVDAQNALDFLAERSEQSGLKITITHLVGKAVAEAIAARPDVNAVVRRGRHIYQRESVDIFFQVAFDGGEDLSGAKISNVDRKSVEEIARELAERAARVRAHADRELTPQRELLSRIPAFLRGPAMHAAEFLSYDLGLNLSRLGLPFDAFGSAMVTNVGMFGLPSGFAPLVPFSRAPIVITVGTIEPRPRAVEGEVKVRPVLPIGATLDHRLLDGFQVGQLTRRFREVLEDPVATLGSPASG
jgi:pyruvate dehydrogenase E2 component (dihydrolipoamide acetyltransferase)